MSWPGTLRNGEVELLLKSCISLKTLFLHCGDIPPHQVEDLIDMVLEEHSSTLETLHLHYFTHVTYGKCLNNVIKKCVKLRDLEFEGHLGHSRNSESVSEIQNMVDNFPTSIEKLSLGRANFVYDNHVKIIVERCTNIKVLDLRSTGTLKIQ